MLSEGERGHKLEDERRVFSLRDEIVHVHLGPALLKQPIPEFEKVCAMFQ